MAMANKSLACFLSLFVFLLFFALSTEARFVTNDERQVKSSDQVFEMTVGNEPKPPYYVQGAIYDTTQKIEQTGADDEANVWCIVKPTTGDQRLQFNLDFSCGNVDCSFIEPGGPCFFPNNNYAHASAAMNFYYKSYRYQGGDCNFWGSGLLVNQDPSGGTCRYV